MCQPPRVKTEQGHTSGHSCLSTGSTPIHPSKPLPDNPSPHCLGFAISVSVSWLSGSQACVGHSSLAFSLHQTKKSLRCMLDPYLEGMVPPTPTHPGLEVACEGNGGFSFSTVDLERQAELHGELP